MKLRSRPRVIPIQYENPRESSGDWDWPNRWCSSSVFQSRRMWTDPSHWSWNHLVVGVDWVVSCHWCLSARERMRRSMLGHHVEGISMLRQWRHTSIAWRTRRSPSERRNFVEQSKNSIWSGIISERQEQDTRHSWSADFSRRPVSVGCEIRRSRCQSCAMSRWKRPKLTAKGQRSSLFSWTDTHDREDLHCWPRFIPKQTFTQTVEECEDVRSTHSAQ